MYYSCLTEKYRKKRDKFLSLFLIASLIQKIPAIYGGIAGIFLNFCF